MLSPQHYSEAERGACFSAVPLTKIANNEFQAKPTFSPNKLGQYHRYSTLSLLCSEWEEVGHVELNYQEIIINNFGAGFGMGRGGSH